MTKNKVNTALFKKKSVKMNWQEHVRNDEKLRAPQFNQFERPPLLADIRSVAGCR